MASLSHTLAAWWPLLALAFSLCGAVIIGYNQWAQVPGNRLVVLRILGIAPLTLLAAMLLPWPTEGSFYLGAALMGLALAWADILLFNAAAKHGGRLTALYIPLKMLLGFLLWAILQPSSLAPLFAVPWQGLAVLLGFALCSIALGKLRQSDASYAALIAIFPVAILFTLGDVVAKLLLEPIAQQQGMPALLGHTIAFLTVTTSVASVVGLLSHGWFRPTARQVWRSALFGTILILSLTLLLVTLALAPNPGYVAAITMLSALWLALWAAWRGREVAQWPSILALLGGAMLIAIAGH